MENPYVSASADGLSAAMHAAAAMRSAADQAAARQEAARKQGLAEQLDMARLLNEGWEEYQPSQNVQTQGSGLKTRDYQPPPSSLVTLPHIGPNGKQLYRPDQTAKEKQAAQQQGYTDLMTALRDHGQPLDENGNVTEMPNTPRYQMDEQGAMTPDGYGVHVPPRDPSRVVTPPNSGRSVYMPSDDQTLLGKLNTEAQARQGTPTVDTEHFSAPVSIDHSTGKVTPLQLPEGVTHNDKADKPEKYTYNHFTDDNGRVTVTRIAGQEGNPEKWNGKAWVPLEGGAAVGPRRKDPDAPAKPKPPSRAQLVTIEGKKATAMRDSTRQFQKDIAEAKNGLGEETDAYRNHYDRLASAQTAYEQEIGAATGNDIPHNDWADKLVERAGQQQAEAAAPAQKPKAGGGRGATSKRGALTDANIAQDYLKRAGGDKQKARALAKADGWEF